MSANLWYMRNIGFLNISFWVSLGILSFSVRKRISGSLSNSHSLIFSNLSKINFIQNDNSPIVKKHIRNKVVYEDFFKNVARPTWHPIIYISYSILNGFKTWQELDYIRENNDMCNVIKNIAIINANKHYSLTGTWTDDNNLYDGFKKFEKILRKQIHLLEPNILIFGNTDRKSVV